ncbi:MAG: PEF-CTERM sorting domain-containing protein [Euryarchaeota archaeon]|nr:PEF-CTERM sorting domain-containing protein [Euryarchaeota archaeon]
MKRIISKAITLLLVGIIVSSMAYPAVAALSRTYTLDADFDEGTLVGVEHTSVADQLQLSKTPSALPFIWIPNSNEGTVSKVNTETGQELGRYRTGPQDKAQGSPSRTTVDLSGNVWFGNRATGTVVKIGLYEAGQCEDRNSDGVIQTSQDINGDGDITNQYGTEILAWPSYASFSNDECVLKEVFLGVSAGTYENNEWGIGPRGIAIDSSNNVWAGSNGQQKYYYINGVTGAIIKTINTPNNKPYGAVVDKLGILWSSGQDSNTVARIDPSTDAVSYIYPGHFVYGIGLDTDNHLFVSGWESSKLSRINVLSASKDWTKIGKYQSRGVAVTPDNDVWVATSPSNIVTRYDHDGVEKAVINVGNYPTGVSVDNAGKVWAVNLNDGYIKRINPATDTIDLSKLIKGITGSGIAQHYGYSDMTGYISRSITTKIGTWTVDYDSGAAGTTWGKVSWNGYTPPGTSITVKVRSSPDGTTWGGWETASSGVSLSSTSAGQYLQVQTTLQIVSGDVSPILYDLTVASSDGTTAIPEFPTIALPILSVIGLMALMYNRRREE